MPRCPTCRKFLSGERDEIGARCPQCREPLYEQPFDEERSALHAGSNVCAVHAGNAALGTCRRCGNFLCGLCRTRWRDQTWCAACVARALEAHEASPEEASGHLRQSILGLVFGVAAWVISLLAIVVMAAAFMGGDADQVNMALAGFGFIILSASPLCSILGVGQAAAAIRTRGDHMIMATAGLIVSGLNTAVVVGLFSLMVWQN